MYANLRTFTARMSRNIPDSEFDLGYGLGDVATGTPYEVQPTAAEADYIKRAQQVLASIPGVSARCFAYQVDFPSPNMPSQRGTTCVIDAPIGHTEANANDIVNQSLATIETWLTAPEPIPSNCSQLSRIEQDRLRALAAAGNSDAARCIQERDLAAARKTSAPTPYAVAYQAAQTPSSVAVQRQIEQQIASVSSQTPQTMDDYNRMVSEIDQLRNQLSQIQQATVAPVQSVAAAETTGAGEETAGGAGSSGGAGFEIPGFEIPETIFGIDAKWVLLGAAGIGALMLFSSRGRD